MSIGIEEAKSAHLGPTGLADMSVGCPELMGVLGAMGELVSNDELFPMAVAVGEAIEPEPAEQPLTTMAAATSPKVPTYFPYVRFIAISLLRAAGIAASNEAQMAKLS